MPLSGKIETVVELKSPAYKFYDVWRKESFHIPKHTPKNIQAVDVHEGHWEHGGTIKIWKYTIEGKPEIVKEKVEFDDANKTITIVALEGDLMKIYKVYKAVLQLTPKGSGSVVNVSIEYEKLHPKVPVPEIYIDLIVSMTKDIDESLSKA